MNKVVSGSLLCSFCRSEHIKLGRTPRTEVKVGDHAVVQESEVVTIPVALRKVISSGPRGILLDCGHRVLKFPPLLSAKEVLEFSDGSTLQGHLPVGAA
jgi:hypothetical protein